MKNTSLLIFITLICCIAQTTIAMNCEDSVSSLKLIQKNYLQVLTNKPSISTIMLIAIKVTPILKSAINGCNSDLFYSSILSGPSKTCSEDVNYFDEEYAIMNNEIANKGWNDAVNNFLTIMNFLPQLINDCTTNNSQESRSSDKKNENSTI